MPKLSLFLALSLVACGSGDDGKPAVLVDGDVVTVSSVIKGDEVKVDKAGKEARVRLVGIYAFAAVLNDPQVKALSAGGLAALEELVKGQKVKIALLETQKQDSTGRYLAYLDKDGTDVAKKLLEDGWAVVYTEFAFGREAAYLAAETSARSASRNIWGLKAAADLVDGLKKQWVSSRR